VDISINPTYVLCYFEFVSNLTRNYSPKYFNKSENERIGQMAVIVDILTPLPSSSSTPSAIITTMPQSTSRTGDITPDYSIGDSGHSAANREAVAVSAAMMGEIITESPSIRPRRVRSGLGGINRHSISQDRLQELLKEHDHPTLMERGMNWWKTRQEKIQQDHLLQLADEQRRILYEAEHGTEVPYDNHQLSENSTFNQMTNQRSQQSSPHPDNEDDITFKDVRPSKSGVGVSVAFDVHEQDDNFWVPEANIEEEQVNEGYPFCPYLLSQKQRQSIATLGLPPSLAYCRWKRLYSLARDGDSFESFLRLVQGYSHTLLVIKTTKDHLLGGYADSEWKAQHQGNPEFFGSAQAFLFRIPDKDSDESIVYKWTGANRYIQFVDVKNTMLAFGGGGSVGSFGLCVEKEFQRGSSGTCATFENEPLCPDEHFEIINVECYGFLSMKF
jgi:hypothetical protein